MFTLIGGLVQGMFGTHGPDIASYEQQALLARQEAEKQKMITNTLIIVATLIVVGLIIYYRKK